MKALYDKIEASEFYGRRKYLKDYDREIFIKNCENEIKKLLDNQINKSTDEKIGFLWYKCLNEIAKYEYDILI